MDRYPPWVASGYPFDFMYHRVVQNIVGGTQSNGNSMSSRVEAAILMKNSFPYASERFHNTVNQHCKMKLPEQNVCIFSVLSGVLMLDLKINEF